MALRRSGAAIATLFVTIPALVATAWPQWLHDRGSARPAVTLPAARAAVARLPLSFQPARGGYLARGRGLQLYLNSSEMLLALTRGTGRTQAVLRTRFVGARRSRPEAELRLPGVVNEFRGSRRNWRTNVPTFSRVRYRSLYPGVDAVFHGDASRLEYDLVVAPGADPSRIALALDGASSIHQTGAGDLEVRAGGVTLREARPVAFQRIAGRRVSVPARFRVDGRRVRFALGSYQRSAPLVIDPVLSYSTYVGGPLYDTAEAVSLGPDGSIYLAGATSSNNYPGTTSRQGSARDDEDAVVTKLTPDGKSIVWTDLFGGQTADTTTTSAIDEAHDIAVDGNGNAYVVGSTGSTDFPQESSATERIGTCSSPGKEGFVLQIDSGGGKTYESCFGGNSDDDAYGVAVLRDPAPDTFARVAITGKTSSTDSWGSSTVDGFDVTPSGGDAFLVELNAKNAGCSAPCHSLRYRAFFASGVGNGVAYDSGHDVVVTGTAGQFFPVSTGSVNYNGDAFVAKVATGTAGSGSLVFSRAYGTGGYENGNALALDSSDNIYVVGDSASDPGDPLPSADTSGNLLRGQGTDGFIAKFNSSGAIQHATYVGGNGEDKLDDIALQETAGHAIAEYVVGTTASTDLGHNAITGQSCAGAAAYTEQMLVVKRIEGAATPGAIVSCLGGSAEDYGQGVAVSSAPTDGTIVVAGRTRGSFPIVGGFQTNFGGNPDAVVARVTQGAPAITSTPPALLGRAPAHFTFTTSEGEMGFACNAPDGSGHLVSGGARTPGACGASTGSADYTGLADGTHIFQVATSDAFGSQSEPVAATFKVDATPPNPFDAVSPPDGAAVASTQPTLSWAATDDPNGVSYDLVIDDQKAETFAPPSCSSGTCTARPAAPVPNGTHTWKVIASDSASPPNTQSTGTRTFVVVDPASARFSMAPNPALAGRVVTFDASASNDATHVITKYEWDLDGDGTFETDAADKPVSTKTYPTPGVITVTLRVTDAQGLTATSAQELRINSPSLTGEQVGVSIDKGAQYTNNPNVTLTIVAPPSATSLLVANDGGFVGALPQPVAREVKWKLDSSGPERLPKTVYLRFLIGTFASPNYTDDIILDERPPVVDAASVVGAATTARAAASKLRKWKVKVRAHDTNSGVGGVQVTTNKRKPGKLLAYRKKVTVKLAMRPKFVRAKDRAGNFSPWRKLR